MGCSCKDWKKWHIPCKHIFAAFCWERDWDWNQFPLEYRQSAYLSTDNMIIEEYFAAQGVCSTDNPGSSEFSLNVTSNEQFQDTKVISSEKLLLTVL